MTDARVTDKWAITIRPREGVSDDQIKAFKAVCDKLCSKAYCTTEGVDIGDMDGRHLHALMVLKVAKRSDSVRRTIRTALNITDEDEVKHAIHIKAATDQGWYEYMTKGEGGRPPVETFRVGCDLDELIQNWLPPKKIQPQDNKGGYKNEFQRIKSSWVETYGDRAADPRGVIRHIASMALADRLNLAKIDRRKLEQYVKYLPAYINGEEATLAEQFWKTIEEAGFTY